ncbi:MAG: FAD-binding monooxygenase, partial [Actinomycetota bacterium]
AMAHFAVSRWDAPLDGGLRDRSLLDVGSGVETRLGVAADTVVVVRPDGHVAAIEELAEGVAEKTYQRITGRASDTEAR